MKEAERKRKFNEFLHLSQEGNLCSSEIVRKLGISINTFYNWRKRLRTETYPMQQPKSVQQIPAPSFSRIVLEQTNNRTAASFIEINVGNTAVIRIPERVSPDILRAILEYSVGRG